MASMRVEYCGPYDEVDVPDLDALVPKGQPIEVDEEIGLRLLEQPKNWRPAEKPAARSTKKTASTKEIED